MTADAASFVSALGFTSVDLLRDSPGSVLAQILAADHPNLISGLDNWMINAAML
jgi:hypothetical protein